MWPGRPGSNHWQGEDTVVSEILGLLFGWTWPVWAFVFVYSLVAAVSGAVQKKNSGGGPASFLAAVSLAVILGGMVSLILMAAGA